MSFYKYLNTNIKDDDDIKLLINYYPSIFEQLPDKVLNCKKIKHFINHNNNNYFLKDKLFLKIWMKYFKWKLLYNNTEFVNR